MPHPLPRRPLLPFLLALLVVGGVLPMPASAQADPARNGAGVLDLEMYWDLQTVSNPQISPDGRQVVYTRGWIDRKTDRRPSEVWIMDADGSRKRFLVEGSSPTWSPDGTRIAFLASGDPGGNQIHIRWMDDEGAVSQITRTERSPSNLRWSPDGTRLAFTMEVPDGHSWSVPMPRRPEGATWTAGPKIVERAVYRRDRQGYVDETWTHLFVVSAEGGAVRQLTDGDWDHSAGGVDGGWSGTGLLLPPGGGRPAPVAPLRDLLRLRGGWDDPAAHGSEGVRTRGPCPLPTGAPSPTWGTTGTPIPTGTGRSTSWTGTARTPGSSPGTSTGGCRTSPGLPTAPGSTSPPPPRGTRTSTSSR
jgi:dipeptidyl aminopeptidase/acylaminoacyl peptidase